MRPDELESLVDRELRQLPTPRAPRSLLPRVMAAVHAVAERPWYARPWFAWPPLAQAASIALLVAAGVAAYTLVPVVRMAAAIVAPGAFATVALRVEFAARQVMAATTALEVVWRTVVQPIGPYAFALVATMCVASAAFGVALNQVVLGRGFQR
jgi:hypothetical protein